MMRTRTVAILSFLFTIAFFIEYTPLLGRVHIPFDLEGFHFPLADYAFQTLRSGNFPQWDWAIYCGLTFAGNPQAALFYPPTWLLFAFKWGSAKLSYQSLENLQVAHLWLAFFLCYVWLRRQRGLHPLASALGAGVFAFSGYMLMHLQHFGVIAGYAWMPLGFSGIDAADERGAWRPLWKLVTASALCLLAGYPPMWVVFAVCMLAYACGRKGVLRCAPLAAAALAGSLLVAAIQLLPSWEASRLAVQETRYGSSSDIRDPEFLISYFVPNYFDFGLDVPHTTNPGKEYQYLGAAAFAGLALLILRKRVTDLGPPLAVLFVSLLFSINPFGLAARAIWQSHFLAQVFSASYFLAGLTASAALFAALGLDYGLRRASRPVSAWLVSTAVILALAWSTRLIVLWNKAGGSLAAGWMSGVDALAAAILFGLLILIYAGSSGPLRTIAAATALILVGAEYKAFGTSKRFNASRGAYNVDYVSQPFPELNTGMYETLRQHPEYRLAVDVGTLFPHHLRHNGLLTPQGFDPLLPAQYKALMERIAHFRTNREFDVIPEDEATLRLLGVRYYISSEQGPMYSRLSSIGYFHKLQPDDSHKKVFEYANARPAFGWDQEEAGDALELKSWAPERREFIVRSASGGRFRLTEQFFPGWTATIDRVEASIERCHEAFQCIAVGPGEHRVEFRYHSRWLVVGGVISCCSLLLMLYSPKRQRGDGFARTPSPR